MDGGKPVAVEPCTVAKNDTVANVGIAESSEEVGDGNLEPYVGMEFDSDENVKIFYNDYARRVGFSVRTHNHYRSKRDNSVICRTFVCYKEGYRRKKDGSDEGVQHPRPITREGCNAMLTVKKQKDGKWYVTKFEKEHNHALVSPNQVFCLRSHRRTLDPKRKLIDVCNETGLDAKEIMNVLRAESGRISKVGSTEKDCMNYIGTGRLSSHGIDAQTVLDYFKCMQASNPAFFYAIQVDKDESLSSVFWVDARSRISYNHFFDIVYFDTTYKTNQYLIPFAHVTGVNHHRQSVLFGCALLSNESESTFIWLFKTWLEAMLGQHPGAIITDHDKDITAAVANVFPKSRHCFCKSQILRKVPKILGHIYRANDNFGREFNKCINSTETINEFESAWWSLLEKYNLQDNEWLQSLYNDREQWVPVYLRDTFLAGMSTQRNESMKLLFDGYVDSKTTLNDFFKQYEKALDNQCEKEIQADYSSLHTKPVLTTPIPMEEQAANLYTREVFKIFKEELVQSLALFVKRSGEDGESNTYLVSKFDQNKEYAVTFNSSETRGSCTCKMFEFEGILCKHLLALFRTNNIFMLPSHYILIRWTKDAKKVVLNECGIAVQDKCPESMTARYNSLCHKALKFAKLGSTTHDVYKVALCSIQEATEKIIAAIESVGTVPHIGSPISENSQEHNINIGSQANSLMNQVTVQDPLHATAKEHSQTNSRYKAPLDKPMKQKRTSGVYKVSSHMSQISPGLEALEPNIVTGQTTQGLMFVASQGTSQETTIMGQQLDQGLPFIPSQCDSQKHTVQGQSHREIWFFPSQYIHKDNTVMGHTRQGISSITGQSNFHDNNAHHNIP